jgi:methyl-accepting chemotaxis protein
MKKRSLGFKLIFGGIVNVLVPILVIGLYSLNKSSDALTKLSKEQAVVLAHNLADLVQLALSEETNNTKSLASRVTVKAAVRKVRSSGVEEAQSEIAALNQSLASAMKESGSNYEAVIVADKSGKVFGDSEGGKHKGMDISGRSYFQKAKAEGKLVIADPVESNINGKFIAPFCTPPQG